MRGATNGKHAALGRLKSILPEPAILSSELSFWWLALCVVSAINFALWGVSAIMLAKHRARWTDDVYKTRQTLLWLSAVYVLGCGFRSVFPMIEVPRMCLHDIWISRVAITRTVATVAELCFAAQWAILLHEAGTATGSRLTSVISRLIVPIVILAELSCWYAVLSATYLPHALENSLWTLAATVAVTAFISLWPRVGRAERRFLAVVIAGGLAYIAFMVAVDVPMYLSRWQADLAAGHQARALLAGLDLSLQRCIVENDWSAWREDAVWLSLYFTAAVWVSIWLLNAPNFVRKNQQID